MLVGTVVGVLVIPGLYYLFGRIADGRKLLRDEVDEPLSELLEHEQLPPDEAAGDGTVRTATAEAAPPAASSSGQARGPMGTPEGASPEAPSGDG